MSPTAMRETAGGSSIESVAGALLGRKKTRERIRSNVLKEIFFMALGSSWGGLCPPFLYSYVTTIKFFIGGRSPPYGLTYPRQLLAGKHLHYPSPSERGFKED